MSLKIFHMCNLCGKGVWQFFFTLEGVRFKWVVTGFLVYLNVWDPPVLFQAGAFKFEGAI